VLKRVTVPVLLVVCAACGGGSSGGGDSDVVSDHLSVVPVSGDAPECEGAFTAGQSVEITDPRFAVGAQVTLQITPPGGSPQSSTLTADGTGTIKSTIQLPQTPGSAYITVTGVSANGTQTNDTVGVDIVATGAACDG
jgi:hypothetical protein